jgi:hypothetical protein
MMKSVDSLGRAVRGASTAFDGIGKIVGKVVSHIFQAQYGVPTEIAELEVFMNGIQQWFVDVQEIVELGTFDRLEREPALCARVQELYRQGFQFVQQATALKMERRLMQPFNVHWQVLRKYYEKAGSSSAFTGGPRHEPLVIYLSGESGQGKSALMYFLATELLKVDGIPRDVNGKLDITQEIYTRMAENEYWDGYKNQRVCLFDDIFQVIDSPANPNTEIMEIIRTGNLTKLPLHMAELSDKGSTCFNSKIVICTSNTPIHSYFPKSISCVDALRRRVDVNARIEAKPEFCRYDRNSFGKRFLDRNKVRAKFGQDMHEDVYDVFLEDPINGDSILVNEQKRISFKDLVLLAAGKYEAKFKASSAMHDFLAEMAERPPVAQIGIPTWDSIKGIFFKPRVIDPVEFAQMDLANLHLEMKTPRELSQLPHDEVINIVKNIGQLRRIFNTRLANDIWIEQNELIIDPIRWSTLIQLHASTRTVWADLAGRILVNEVGNDCELTLISASLVAEVKEKVPEPMLVLLKRNAEEYKKMATSWLDKAKKIVSEHPLLCAAAAIVPLLLFALYKWMGVKREEVSDFFHSNLEAQPGKRVVHKHHCVRCGKIFEHAHEISTIRDSLNDLPMCGTCAPEWQAAYNYGRENVEIFPRDPNLVCTEAENVKTLTSFFTDAELDELLESRLGHQLKVELAASGDPKTRKKVLRVQLTTSGDPHTQKQKKVTVESQFRSDRAAHEVSEKILSNIYTIAVGDGVKFPHALKIVMIRGRVGLTVAHLLPYLEQNTHVELSSPTMSEGMIFPVSELHCYQVYGQDKAAKDQMLIEFPRRFPMQLDIVKHMATSHDMSMRKVPIVLVNPSHKSFVFLKYGEACALDKPLEYLDENDKTLSIRSYYKYALETAPGDCGSIMVGIGKSIQHKIMGVHIAGGTGTGYASPINAKDILATLEQIPIRSQIQLDMDPLLNYSTTEVLLPEGNFIPIGEPLYPIPRPVKTKLKESAVFELVTEATTAPSILRKVKLHGKVVDPLMKGLKKAGCLPPPLNNQLLEVCANDVARILTDNILPDHRRVLTNMEAVAGIEMDEYAPGITRTTSPGYPLVRFSKGKGKQQWLGSDEYLLPKEVEDEMIRIENNAKQGIRTPTVWTDTLKDERRPLEKISEAKTRVFSAGPMCYTLVFRKYFLGFAAHCARNRIDNEIAVGTNVYSMDWHHIAERMQSKGKKVIAGDFTNFDGTLVIEFLWAILDIINLFYNDGEENMLVREVLWVEIVNSIHVFENSVYMWTHSQPSGCPLTAIINSIYNSLSMRYVWLLKMPVEMRNMQAFGEHVAMISYGDDNIVNISDAIIDQFNQVIIAEGYAIFGMTYTDESKSGELVPFRTIGDISFLKRGFLRDRSGLYRAPLGLDTTLEMINWVRGDLDIEDKTCENMQTAAFELSLHSDEVFKKWIPKFQVAGATMQQQPQLLTLYEYRTSVLVKMQGLVAAS